jgi:membrane-associated phospholipid phosphatase
VRPKNNDKKLVLLVWFLVSLFISWFLSAVGLFLSLWVIVPEATLSLFPLAVGAPEISPWLVGINAITRMLTIFRRQQGWLYNTSLVCSVLALILSLIPLLQFPAANTRIAAEVQAVLGADYLAAVPKIEQVQLRPQPFILADAFPGIPRPGSSHE